MMRYMLGSTTVYLFCMGMTYSVAWNTVVPVTNGTCFPNKLSSRLCGNQSEIVHPGQALELRCPNGTHYLVAGKLVSNETLNHSECQTYCPAHNRLVQTGHLTTNCTGVRQASCLETVLIDLQPGWSENDIHFAEIAYECVTDNMTNMTETTALEPTPVTTSIITPSVGTARDHSKGTTLTLALATTSPTTLSTISTAPIPITTTSILAMTTTTTNQRSVVPATACLPVDDTKSPPPAPAAGTDANATSTSIVTETLSPGKPEIYIIIIVGAAVLVAVAVVVAVIIRRRRKTKRTALIPDKDLVLKAAAAKGQTIVDDKQRHSNGGYTEIDLDDDADDTRLPHYVISDLGDCAVAFDSEVKIDGFIGKVQMKQTVIDVHLDGEKSKKDSNGHKVILFIDVPTVGKEQRANCKLDEEIRQDDQTEEEKVQHKTGDGYFTEREQMYVNSDEETGHYVNQKGTKQTGLENGQICPVGTNPNPNPKLYHSLELLPQEDKTDTTDVVFLRGGQKRRPFLGSSDQPNAGTAAPNGLETQVRSSAGSNFSSSDRESDHYYSEIKDSILVDEDDYTVPDEAPSRREAARRISEGDYEAVDFGYDEEAGVDRTTMYKAAMKDGRGGATISDEAAFDDGDDNVLVIENDTYESTAAMDDDKDRGDDRVAAVTKVLESLDHQPGAGVTCRDSCLPSSKEQTVHEGESGDGREKIDDESDEKGFMFDNDIYIPFNT